VLLIETSFETLYEGQALFGDIWERLQSWRFDFKENLDEAYAPDDGRVIQADSLFVKKGVIDVTTVFPCCLPYKSGWAYYDSRGGSA
jgi:hypothetical protein